MNIIGAIAASFQKLSKSCGIYPCYPAPDFELLESEQRASLIKNLEKRYLLNQGSF